MHGVEAKQSTCPAIDGIIKAGNDFVGDIASSDVLDAVLTAAAQVVEHYEIAQYGTLIAWARELGRNDCASILAETLAEERATDEKLTHLDEPRPNREAERQPERPLGGRVCVRAQPVRTAPGIRTLLILGRINPRSAVYRRRPQSRPDRTELRPDSGVL